MAVLYILWIFQGLFQMSGYEFGSWLLAFSIWLLAFGLWNLSFGFWDLVPIAIRFVFLTFDF